METAALYKFFYLEQPWTVPEIRTQPSGLDINEKIYDMRYIFCFLYLFFLTMLSYKPEKYISGHPGPAKNGGDMT